MEGGTRRNLDLELLFFSGLADIMSPEVSLVSLLSLTLEHPGLALFCGNF